MAKKKDFKVGMIVRITHPFQQINHLKNKIGRIEHIEMDRKYSLEIKVFRKDNRIRGTLPCAISEVTILPIKEKDLWLYDI